MKRRNTITAVFLLAFLVAGCGLLGIRFLAGGGALRAEVGLLRQDSSQLTEFVGGGAESAVNEDLDKDHYFIQLFGGFQRLTGRRVVEDSAGGNPVVKLNNGTLNFVTSTTMDCSANGEKTAAFQQTLAEMGIPSLYVVAPQKVGRDMDLLPTGVNSYGNAEADSFLAALDAAGTDYLDLRDTFEETADYSSWFFRTDHHWTPEAGFFAWQTLNRVMDGEYGLNIPENIDDPAQWETAVLEDFFLGSQGKRVGTFYAGVDDFTIFTPKFDTDLTYTCPFYAIDRTGTFNQSVCFPERVAEQDWFNGNPYTYYAGGDYPLATVTNHNNPDGPRILLIRDSFACAVTPFLALSCSELTTVDLRYFRGDLMQTIEELRPNLVITLYTASSVGVEELFAFGVN